MRPRAAPRAQIPPARIARAVPSQPRYGAAARDVTPLLPAELLVEHADPDDRAVPVLEVQLAGRALRLLGPGVDADQLAEPVEQDELVVGRLGAVRLADRV